MKPRMVEYLGIVSLLLAFEFVNLVLHPHIVKVTHHNNVFMLLVLVTLAALMVPLHHRVEHRIKQFLLEKKNTAKMQTIEEEVAFAGETDTKEIN